MTFKVKKIITDESSFGYAISDDIANEGSIFDLSGNDLIIREDFNAGIGIFDVDLESIVLGATSDDLLPTNETGRVDTYFEIDGSGNITTKV